MSFNNRKKGSGGSRKRKVLIILNCVAITLLAVMIGLLVFLNRTAGNEDSFYPTDSPPTQPGVTQAPVTEPPTEPPTEAPTEAPTNPPTEAPTEPPTEAPTEPPTEAPTEPPTEAPTQPPTEAPTKPTQPKPPQNTKPDKEENKVADGNLTCDKFAAYSGQFVEDGRDEVVQNVAVLLVTNRSDQFLDLATITYEVDGKTATFIVTGLPAGRSAWVLEAQRMTVSASTKYSYVDCVYSLRDNVTASTSKITVTAQGNMLTATNNTGTTLHNVAVYYKVLHSDGKFLGGLTYLVDFGTLEPGASAEVLAGHYSQETAEIVRIGWQE